MDIAEVLEKILEQFADLNDRLDRMEEAIANVSLPGSGYSVITPNEDY